MGMGAIWWPTNSVAAGGRTAMLTIAAAGRTRHSTYTQQADKCVCVFENYMCVHTCVLCVVCVSSVNYLAVFGAVIAVVVVGGGGGAKREKRKEEWKKWTGTEFTTASSTCASPPHQPLPAHQKDVDINLSRRARINLFFLRFSTI